MADLKACSHLDQIDQDVMRGSMSRRLHLPPSEEARRSRVEPVAPHILVVAVGISCHALRVGDLLVLLYRGLPRLAALEEWYRNHAAAAAPGRDDAPIQKWDMSLLVDHVTSVHISFDSSFPFFWVQRVFARARRTSVPPYTVTMRRLLT